jgi:uncharacterized protein
MKSAFLFRVLFLFTALGLGAAVVHAEDRGAVLARMEQRLGAIDALKERKLIGENNRGYVEARGTLTASDEKTVSDENSDRRAVYSSIAAETGSTPEQVGRLRAQKIAANTKRGVWIQAPDGQWSEKG